MDRRIILWFLLLTLISEASVLLPGEELFCGMFGCFRIPVFASDECDCVIDGLDSNVCADTLHDIQFDPGTSVSFTNFTVPGASLSMLLQFIGESTTCVPLTAGVNITAVSTCPDSVSWQDKQNCEQNDDSSLPPVDYPSLIDITFKNVYCALCHGIEEEEAFSKLTPWSVSYTCNQPIDVLPPVEMTKVIDDGSTCTAVYGSSSYKDKVCANLMTYVIDFVPNYCLKCLETEKLNVNASWNVDCGFCEFAVKIARFHMDCGLAGEWEDSSLTRLFELPKSPEQRIQINNQLFKISAICADDEKFDNLFQKCRKFQCKFDQYPKSGECWDNSTVYIPSNTQPFLQGADTLFINIETRLVGQFVDEPFGLSWKTLTNDLPWTLLDITEKGDIFSGSASIKVNISTTTVTETIDSVSSIKLDKDNFRYFFQFYNFQNVSEVNCPQGTLRCLSNATMFFVKEVGYAREEAENQTRLYPIENILFNMTVSSNATEADIELQEICVCDQVDDISALSCSHTIYNYDEMEYKVHTNGDLKILGHGFSFGPKEYFIKNSIAYVCYNPGSRKVFFSMDKIQQYVSWTCSAISVLCLIITIVTYYIFNQLLNIPAKLNIGVALSLIVGQVLLPLPIEEPTICRYIAAVTHFSWLSAFIWMSAQAAQMLITFHPQALTSYKSGGRFRYYCTVCIIIPLVIVLVCLILDLIPGNHTGVQYGVASCTWMSSRNGYIYAFFVPIGLSLIFNFVCFSMTLYFIERTLVSTEMTIGKKRDKKRCLMYVRLSSVMGFTWIFGFIASYFDISALWYIYIILNGLQGVFIFLSFCCNHRNKEIIKCKISETRFTNIFTSSQHDSRSNTETRSSVNK